ncbi:hypothetical protein [Streptosporangium roseum]
MPAVAADLTDPATLRPDVEQVLGRAPRTFADWAQRNPAAFR